MKTSVPATTSPGARGSQQSVATLRTRSWSTLLTQLLCPRDFVEHGRENGEEGRKRPVSVGGREPAGRVSPAASQDRNPGEPRAPPNPLRGGGGATREAASRGTHAGRVAFGRCSSSSGSSPSGSSGWRLSESSSGLSFISSTANCLPVSGLAAGEEGETAGGLSVSISRISRGRRGGCELSRSRARASPMRLIGSGPRWPRVALWLASLRPARLRAAAGSGAARQDEFVRVRPSPRMPCE